MAIESLWGEFPDFAKQKFPVAILREQAVLLEEKTNHILEARVDTRREKEKLIAELFVLAPYTDQLRIVTIWSSSLVYPIYVANALTADAGDSVRLHYTECVDDLSLRDTLRQILSSPPVMNLVIALAAHFKLPKPLSREGMELGDDLVPAQEKKSDHEAVMGQGG